MAPLLRALCALALAFPAAGCIHIHESHTFGNADLRAEATREVDLPLEIAAGGKLTADIPSGSIQARVAAGPATVHARLKVRAATEAEAAQLLEQVALRARADGDGVRLVVDTPESNDGRFWVSSDVEVTLPERCALDLSTGTGDVRCETGPFGASKLASTYGAVVANDVHGGLTAKSGSGNVKAAGVHGGAIELKSGYGAVGLADAEGDSIQLTSGSGNVELARARAPRVEVSTTYGRVALRDVEGEVRGSSGSGEVRAETWSGGRLELKSGYGAVEVKEARGDLELKSGSGNVVVEACEGGVSAQTTYGAVRVDGVLHAAELESGSGNVRAVARAGSRIEAGWTLKSGYGELLLTVPPDLAFDLVARTTYGRLDIGVPIEVQPGGLKERQVEGKVRGGGGRVSMVTGNGSVKLVPGS